MLKRTEVLEEIERLWKTAARRRGHARDRREGRPLTYESISKERPTLLRHLGQSPPVLQVRSVRVGEALEGLTVDEQLEVAGQLTMATLRAARHRFEG